ncbi:MAG: phosphate ABC transporter permease PstA [Hyphomonadaceae bacterium]
MQTSKSANYYRRRIGDAVMNGLCTVAALIGLVLLLLILYMLIERGAGALSGNVFFHSMATPGQGGGLANAIVGTLIQAGLGTLIGAPLGMLVGVYLSEIGRNGKLASLVRFVNDILLSAPSVLIGLFVYQIAVAPFGGFSAWAGAIALALIAMPVVARTTEDILRLVPDAYRDGAIALGSRDNETIRRVVLPAAFGGILTGILLAVARISGETAPLIFTSLGNSNWSLDLGKPMASLPIAIYRYASSPYDEWKALAWAGALIITVGVLALNVASRVTHHVATRGR